MNVSVAAVLLMFTCAFTTAKSLSLNWNNQQKDMQNVVKVPSSVETVHVIILVHGWMGNPSELRFLETTLNQLAQAHHDTDQSTYFVVHSAKANDGNTMDGIAAGGGRVAVEVNGILADIQKNDKRQVSLSFVGNSLGGLYARYVLSEISAIREGKIRPSVFCTIATPHLGVSEHTFWPIPRLLEQFIARTMMGTGRDLFRISNTIDRMTTERRFVEPLREFSTRLAYINAHNTDFQVPTPTAGFLCDSSEINHYRLPTSTDMPHEVFRAQTARRNDMEYPTMTKPISIREMALLLDEMGWTKVFCDVREHVLAVPLPPILANTSHARGDVVGDWHSSSDLLRLYGSQQIEQKRKLYMPFGHTVLVANAKSRLYEQWNSGGRPIMTQLATELLQYITSEQTVVYPQFPAKSVNRR
ncbi:hypothetical protein FisN_4Lh143 [Fistulifera solaris]|uniref:DUF676 domain-containing protein n=1 Tax=Fistulifera solaris TaxID=1519565 RepID=A0A1Z5JZT7_FISSO|nr:hypothetical protein FisN_4Lh143 [Fistulifera solaris]|eukprot:GAX19281.1 hypothetical protein FisN_4Lh143 [Fistulifera solaris]